MVNLAESYKKEHWVISINLIIPMGFLQTFKCVHMSTVRYILYLEFGCPSRSLATFSKKLALEKLMPVGDALSLLVPIALVIPPLFMFVIK